jgi:DNA repair exonuclease SbcCD ATPase subunit
MLDGSSVTDKAYSQRAEETYGDKDTFLATTFKSQRARCDLLRSKPAARANILREMYGLSSFDARHDMVRAEIKKYAGATYTLEAKKDQWSHWNHEGKAARAERKSLEEKIKTIQLHAEDYEKNRTHTHAQEAEAQHKRHREFLEKEIQQKIRTPLARWHAAHSVFLDTSERFEARALKAGCRTEKGEVLDCPLLERPLPPEKSVWAEYLNPGFTLEDLENIPLSELAGRDEEDTLQYILELAEKETGLAKDAQKAKENVVTDLLSHSVQLGEAQGLLAAAKKMISTAQKMQDALQAEIGELEKSAKHMELLTSLEKVLSPYGLSQWWLERQFPLLRDTVQQYLDEFPAGGMTGISISSLDISVETTEGVIIPVEAVSGGQESLLSIMFRMALSPGMLIMDEPFVGMDAYLKPQVAAWLGERAAEAQIVVVTHEAEVTPYARKVLFV